MTKIDENDLEMWVNEACTCGGGEPYDCCPACMVWHYYIGIPDYIKSPQQKEREKYNKVIAARTKAEGVSR